MMRSMTGFARESRGFHWGTLTVELSSVNHRYQELSIRIPREMNSLEGAIASLLRAGLGRGKIRFSATIDWSPQYKTFTIDREVLGGYYNQLASVAKDLGIEDGPSFSSLLSLPGVMESAALADMVEETVGQALDEIAGAAIEKMVTMREEEGRHLGLSIAEYLGTFETLLGATMRGHWEGIRESTLEEHRKKISTLLGEALTETDQTRIAQEVAILADKWDIAEEIVRSVSHIKQFRTIMDGTTSEGRKLDFLIQEMNREVNTMGSKIADVHFRWMVVEAKNLLEKIREQIQNVE